jgi:hypothetical protein
MLGAGLLDVILPNTVCSAGSLSAGAGASTAFLVHHAGKGYGAHQRAPGLASPVWFRLEALRQMHKERTAGYFRCKVAVRRDFESL